MGTRWKQKHTLAAIGAQLQASIAPLLAYEPVWLGRPLCIVATPDSRFELQLSLAGHAVHLAWLEIGIRFEGGLILLIEGH